MTNPRFLQALLVNLTLTFAALASATTTGEPELASGDRIAIDGRVVGQGGRGLAGVRVELRPILSRYDVGVREIERTGDPAPAAWTVSTADGRFKVMAPEPGMWAVTVRGVGTVPLRALLLPLLEPVSLADVELEPDAGLRVRVETLDGRSIAGVRVLGERVQPGAATSPWQPVPRRAVTRPGGEAHLARSAGEALRVWAVAPGWAEAESPAVRGSRVTLQLRRSPPRRIELSQMDGTAVPGVIFRDARSGLVLGRARPGRKRGRLAAGASGSVLAETADGRRLTLPRSASNRELLAWRLPRPTVLEGRVLDTAGRPLSGAWVWPAGEPGLAVRSDAGGLYRLERTALRPNNLSESTWRTATGEPARALAADGRLREDHRDIEGNRDLASWIRRLNNLPDGAAPPWDAVAAAATGHLPALGPPIDRTLPILVLPDSLSLSGTVVDAQGSPVAEARVRAVAGIVEAPPTPWAPQAFTSPAGTFRIVGVQSGGGYRIAVDHPGFAPAVVPLGQLGTSLGGLRVVLRTPSTVTGRLVDPQGRPVTSAEVCLAEMQGAELSRAAVDGDGRFTLSGPPSGHDELRVLRPGAARFRVPGIDVPGDGKGIDLGAVVVAAGETLAGRVSDPAGGPLAGAEVWLRIDVDRETGWDAAPATHTEPDGTFALSSLPPGSQIQLAACLHGSVPEVVELLATPPDPLTIVLPPAGELNGTVVDDEGRAVAGAGVTFRQVGVFPDRLRSSIPCAVAGKAVVTDGEGHFTLADLERGWYTVAVEAPGFVRRETAPTEAGDRRDGIRIALDRGGALTGRVADEKGDPVVGARVTAEGAGRARSTARTQGDGRYRMEVVALGQVEVYAWSPEQEIATVLYPTEIRPGENALDLALPRLGPAEKHTVSGRVIDPVGRPVAGAVVSMLSRAATAIDGSFSFTVANGDYWVSAEAQGYPATEATEVHVNGGPVSGLEIRLEQGMELRGRVVGLEPAEIPWTRVGLDAERETAVGADGSFRFHLVASGDRQLRAWNGQREVTRVVHIDPGQKEASVDLELVPVHRIRGRVSGPEGEAVAGAAVTLSGLRYVSVNTRNDGTFEVFAESGTYQVSARAAGHPPKRLAATVEVGDEPVADLDIQLGRGIDLTGRVLGFPPGEIPLVEAEDDRDYEVIRGRVEGDGSFHIAGLRPGSWTVRASLPKLPQPPSAKAKITIQEGADGVTLDLVFPDQPKP